MKWMIIGAGCLVIGAAPAFAQGGKIGYVNSQRIFAETPEFQEAQDRFEKEVADWRSRADDMNTVIDSIKLDKEKTILEKKEKT